MDSFIEEIEKNAVKYNDSKENLKERFIEVFNKGNKINNMVYDSYKFLLKNGFYVVNHNNKEIKDEDKMISLNVDERGIPIKEYMNLINQKIISEVDYGKWINFKESYPPLKDKPYDGVLIEILHQGNPFFHSIFHNGERVFLRCYDWHNDLLEYRDPCYTSDYWRFVPAPPGNESYDVG